MRFLIEFRTCRHCGESTQDTNLLKYSVRHYIHPKCAIEKWGADIVNRFPLWQLEKLPYRLLQDANLLHTVREYCVAKRNGQLHHALPGGAR